MAQSGIPRAVAFCLAVVAPYLLLSTVAGIVRGWRAVAANEYLAQGLRHLAARTVAEQVTRDFSFALMVSLILAGVAVAVLRWIRPTWVLLYVYLTQSCLLTSRFLYSDSWAVTMPAFGLPLPGFLWKVKVVVSTVITLLVLYALLGAVLWVSRRKLGRVNWWSGRFSRVSIVAVIVAVGCIGAANVTAALQQPQQASRPINVIWVSWDSTRSDHLSAYGYDRPTSPNVDAFAEDAVLFRYAVSQHNWTRPSYTSMFTSVGTWELADQQLALRHLTLAEILREHGYRTLAFVQNPNLDAEFHLNQGFQRYYQLPGRTDPFRMNDFALKAIREEVQRAEPFFLFLHIQEPHYPYSPDNPYRAEFVRSANPPMDESTVSDAMFNHVLRAGADREEKVQYLVDAYDADIRWADEGFGRFVAELEKAGVLSDSLVIFNSDHGDEFAEHGGFGHSHANLYTELVFVPLVIRFPDSLDVTPTRIEAPVRSIDISPTALEVTGVPAPETISGRSLHPLPRPGDPQRLSFSTVRNLLSVRENRYSLILEYGETTTSRLFDFRDDPAEQHSIADAEVIPEFGALKPSADLWLNKYHAALSSEVSPPDVSEELLERLRGLGYVQ